MQIHISINTTKKVEPMRKTISRNKYSNKYCILNISSFFPYYMQSVHFRTFGHNA